MQNLFLLTIFHPHKQSNGTSLLKCILAGLESKIHSTSNMSGAFDNEETAILHKVSSV